MATNWRRVREIVADVVEAIKIGRAVETGQMTATQARHAMLAMNSATAPTASADKTLRDEELVA